MLIRMAPFQAQIAFAEIDNNSLEAFAKRRIRRRLVQRMSLDP
jgi:hypothetical protein